MTDWPMCAAPDCDLPVRTRFSPYCDKHYTRMYRYGSLNGRPRVKKPKPIRHCLNCNAVLAVRKKSYCSYRCSWRYRRGTPSHRICAVCASPYEIKRSSLVCSDECAVLRQRQLNRDYHQIRIAKPTEREKFRERQQVRRAAEVNAPCGCVSRLQIFERDKWVCQICTEPVDQEVAWPDDKFPTLDHVIPLARGGLHVPENLQCAHLLCNLRKGASI